MARHEKLRIGVTRHEDDEQAAGPALLDDGVSG
jgi:hypothetical protein